MADIEFADGLLVKAPNPKAPSFVKCSISIKVEEFSKWLATKAGQEWVNLDVKESKGGKWYASVSTYDPKAPKKVKEKPNDDTGEIPF